MDTNKAMESFYTGCAAAGPDGCAFWAPTADDIRQNVTGLSDLVRTKPIPTRTRSGYGLFDINKLDTALFTSLYFPYSAFPTLAQGLSELAGGSAKILFDRESPPLYKCACDARLRVSSMLRQLFCAMTALILQETCNPRRNISP